MRRARGDQREAADIEVFKGCASGIRSHMDAQQDLLNQIKFMQTEIEAYRRCLNASHVSRARRRSSFLSWLPSLEFIYYSQIILPGKPESSSSLWGS